MNSAKAFGLTYQRLPIRCAASFRPRNPRVAQRRSVEGCTETGARSAAALSGRSSCPERSGSVFTRPDEGGRTSSVEAIFPPKCLRGTCSFNYGLATAPTVASPTLALTELVQFFLALLLVLQVQSSRFTPSAREGDTYLNDSVYASRRNCALYTSPENTIAVEAGERRASDSPLGTCTRGAVRKRPTVPVFIVDAATKAKPLWHISSKELVEGRHCRREASPRFQWVFVHAESPVADRDQRHDGLGVRREKERLTAAATHLEPGWQGSPLRRRNSSETTSADRYGVRSSRSADVRVHCVLRPMPQSGRLLAIAPDHARHGH
jgi:hypothetical protein